MNSFVQTVKNENVWPQLQLEHYHPVEGGSYSGDQLGAITPIHAMMGVFMLQENTTLNEFVDLCGAAPIHTWVGDVAQAIANYFEGMAADGNIMDRFALLEYHGLMMNAALSAQSKCLFLQGEQKVDRPEFVKHPEWVGTYGTPDEFAFILARVIKTASNYFGNKKEVLLYDTAYLLAMIPAMAGLNSPEACVEGLKQSGLSRG